MAWFLYPTINAVFYRNNKKQPNKRVHILIISRAVTNIKSSIFDFNPNITKSNFSHQKYYVVNKHYLRQTEHQQWPTAISNNFPLSEYFIVIVFIDTNYASDKEYQNNVSIRVNAFGIIPEVKSHEIRSFRDGPQQQPKFPLHQDVSSPFFS